MKLKFTASQRLTGGAAQPTTTLADFLTNMPDYSYTAGESIFMDVFMTLVCSPEGLVEYKMLY